MQLSHFSGHMTSDVVETAVLQAIPKMSTLRSLGEGNRSPLLQPPCMIAQGSLRQKHFISPDPCG